MKILVTGSHGYLAGYFIRQFAQRYTFSTFSLRQEPLESLTFNKIDVVLHAAALVHQKIDHPQAYYDAINHHYPVALAKRAKAHGVRQFIFISTIAVYGDQYHLIDEQTPPAPISPYGRSKYAAEKALEALSDEEFIVTIIRPPMIYGKDAPGNIRSLITLIQKVPLLPLGNIHNRRSFIYIENLTSLIDHLIQRPTSGVILAADDHPVSTTHLIRSLATALHRRIYLVDIPPLRWLLQRVKPTIYAKLYHDLAINNQQTRERLNFHNPFTFERAITYTV